MLRLWIGEKAVTEDRTVREEQEAKKGNRLTTNSSDRPTYKVASWILDDRLKAVCQNLPLAAFNSDEDVEHVHRLRISLRRASEAIRIFTPLMERAEVDEIRNRLRRFRQATDEARNLDVMAERFSCSEDVPVQFLEFLHSERQRVQELIRTTYAEAQADKFEESIEPLVSQVESHRNGRGKQKFGRHAHEYLASAVRNFFEAAESNLTTHESLHALRIRTKKLRYTMEILAAGTIIDSKLFSRVKLIQKLLGTVNDHATAKLIFHSWRSTIVDLELKAFLNGLLHAEEQAAEDLRAAFLATWTPKVVSRLKRRFQFFMAK